MRKTLLGILVFVGMAAGANTGTVTAELSGGTFNVAFANHAHETNSLWVVYDGFDYGSGTNGWGHVERLGTVYPETNTWTYAAPAGWGETVKALRFILSEVPYDYDYSTTYTAADQVPLNDPSTIAQCCRIDNDENFTMVGSHRVYVKFALGKIATAHNETIFLARNSSSQSPFFGLFWIKDTKKFRFDYNSSNKSASKTYTDPDAIIEADASSSGGLVLTVNGTVSETISRPSTAFTAETSGPLLLLAGKTDAVSNAGCSRIYAARVYSSNGDLVLDLVPMVKDGKAGFYDRVHGKVYTATRERSAFRELDAGARIESADPFFADALCTVEATGPDIFMPSSSVTVSQSITNAYGGILDGSAALTLTGTNDWGGSFIVSNGTLVAAFGQGLAATDCLLLNTDHASSGTYGGYGGWNGHATATLGSGAGQICVTDGSYLAYCAADGGELEVDIGGAGAPWTPTADYRRLILNGVPGAGTLRFKNPIVLDDQHFILRVGFGTAIFEESIASVGSGNNARSINCYSLDIASDGVGIFQGKENHFLNFTVNKGSFVLDSGTTNIIDGDLTMGAGVASSLLVTNALVNLTGASGGGAWLNVFGGRAEFAGGELDAGGVYVGETNEQSSVEARRPSLVLRGKVVMTAHGSGNTQSYGSFNVRNSARGDALVFEESADVKMKNLVVHRRNVYHRGGRVELTGGQGVCQMGHEGRTRYWLYTGAELLAPCVKCDYIGAPAHFIFIGGKLTTKASTTAGTPFFVDFGGSDSVIMVASNYGGEFCTKHNTFVTKRFVEVYGDVGAPNGASNWNYTAANWLTAPAFKKTGSKTLTLSGKSTYNCATDVAEGTLVLAGGETPGVLPTNGMLRVTGGTLDLGGNEQTVRALVGTAGAVTNGTLVAKEGIYPGGAGAIGSFTCGAALEGALSIDVDATGACDQIVAQGTLDISNIDLVLPAILPAGVIKLQVVAGDTTGAFRSVENLPQGWVIMPSSTGLWVRKIVGTTILFR